MNKSHVAVYTCSDYDEEKVYNAVKGVCDDLGGVDKYLKPDEKILIKPNFLYPSDADKCLATHPSVIKGFIRVLEESGYTNILCGDSPALGTCHDAYFRFGLDPKYFTPMDEEVLTEGFYFVKEAVECDAIVGLPKMKTHMLEKVTGAVKNMYGLVCGFRKATGHVTHPNAASFAKMTAKIHHLSPQRFHIMDGIMAMDGNGPSSGDPFFMGLILGSDDPIALDSVFCRLVYLDPTLVPTETIGMKAGLGTYKENEIELTLNGAPISMDELVSKCGHPEFDVQREKEKFNILNLWSTLTSPLTHKPIIDSEKCVKCGICVDHCPVEGRAITFLDGKENPPVYNYKKCIRCYCCQEICPMHAIKVK